MAPKRKTPSKKTPAKKTPAKKEKVQVEEEEVETTKSVRVTRSTLKSKKVNDKETEKKSKKQEKKQEEPEQVMEEEDSEDVSEGEDATLSKEEAEKDQKKRIRDAALSLGLAAEKSDKFITLETAKGSDDEGEEEEEEEEEEDDNQAGEGEDGAEGDDEGTAADKALENKKQKSDSSSKKRQVITSKDGVIYLGHIPHGFYENQMKGFFSQFGEVLQLRLSRSPKTGKSRGYAFIQFASAEVASIVQKAMDKYILCGKVLVCELVAPEKVHEKMFLGANKPAHKLMMRETLDIIRRNKPKTVEQKKARLSALKKRNRKQAQNLKLKGIEYELPEPHVTKAKRTKVAA